ncbi:MAG TPA: ATP synthase subunit I [Terriglobia bacterium]|nr:ATP synthase subunit I [Terriglobia bacterium]
MEAETIQTPELARAEARLPLWMIAVAAAGVAAALASGHGRSAAGFGLGAALTILNYYWLHQAVVAVFNAARVRVPRSLIVKLAIRYPLAFAGVYLIHETGWLPFEAVVAGLFVPAAAVLIEAVVQIGAGWRVSEPG